MVWWVNKKEQPLMLTLLRQIAGSGRVLFPLTVVLTASVTVELLSSITHERDPAIRNDSAFGREKTHIKAIADSGNPSHSFMRKSQSFASTGRQQSHFQNARLLKTVYVPIKRSVLQPKTSKLQFYRISSSNREPKTAENRLHQFRL